MAQIKYISSVRPPVYSIEFTVLPVDIPKFKTSMILMVVEEEYQQIYKKYINGVISIDIRERP